MKYNKTWGFISVLLAAVLLIGGCPGMGGGRGGGTKTDKKKKQDSDWIRFYLMRQEKIDVPGVNNTAPETNVRVFAISPENDAKNVDLTPQFGWQLEKSFGKVRAVIFYLYSKNDLDKEERTPCWIVMAIKEFDHFILFSELDDLHAMGRLKHNELKNKGLERGMLYYWRVNVIGEEGKQAKSDLFRFRTKR